MDWTFWIFIVMSTRTTYRPDFVRYIVHCGSWTWRQTPSVFQSNLTFAWGYDKICCLIWQWRAAYFTQTWLHWNKLSAIESWLGFPVKYMLNGAHFWWGDFIYMCVRVFLFLCMLLRNLGQTSVFPWIWKQTVFSSIYIKWNNKQINFIQNFISTVT